MTQHLEAAAPNSQDPLDPEEITAEALAFHDSLAPASEADRDRDAGKIAREAALLNPRSLKHEITAQDHPKGVAETIDLDDFSAAGETDKKPRP